MAKIKGLAPVAAAGLLAMSVVGPVSAVGAVNSTIEVSVLPGGEFFTTTGGVVCPDGWAETTFEKLGGGSGAAASFHGYKTLYCDDGSGTFRITFDAATHFGSPQDQGGWHVIDGTGYYLTLIGGGHLVGTYVTDGIIDLYSGRLMR